MRGWPLWAVMIVLAVAFGGFWFEDRSDPGELEVDVGHAPLRPIVLVVWPACCGPVR